MVTPLVTETLPPWATAAIKPRPPVSAGKVHQRDLVIASLVAERGSGDVYPRRRPAAAQLSTESSSRADHDSSANPGRYAPHPTSPHTGGSPHVDVGKLYQVE